MESYVFIAFLSVAIIGLSVLLIRVSKKRAKAEATLADMTLRFTPITENSQEKRLIESEAFHRTFFEESPIGLVIQDFSAVEQAVAQLKESGVQDIQAYLKDHPEEVARLAEMVQNVRANQAMVALYRAPDIQWALGSITKFVKEGDLQHFIDQVVFFTDGQDFFEGEARNTDFAGNTLHLMIRKVVIQRSENGLSKVLVSLIDVTPMIQAEKEREALMIELQQAQKMEAIGTLAGGVAHDFNNILSIIMGNVELAMDDVPSDHPICLNLQEIKTASLRAKAIVKQLLGFSRKNEQSTGPVHLVPIMEEAIGLLRAMLPANIDIVKDLSVKNDVIQADATQIHQVMINLFTNAGHAMEEEGGRLSVRSKNVTVEQPLSSIIRPISPGRYVKVMVADTGVGIPEEIKRRIFEPYFTTKETGKGTGMGLPMVHGIMESYGGGIVLNSSPGRGTVFELYFPSIDMLPEQDPVFQETQISTGSERILFVDDEQMIVDMVDKILSRLGYRVTPCLSPQNALNLLETDPTAFDLLITDMSMPEMTGKQLIKNIRLHHFTLPVILCTGYSDRLTGADAADLHIDAVLNKPVQMKTLSSIIRRVLDGQDNASCQRDSTKPCPHSHLKVATKMPSSAY